MNFVRKLRKRWAIRGYVRKLPSLLRRDYGAAASYTPAQIRKTIARYDLNPVWSCYAISMFSDRSGFDLYHQSIGESCDYQAMRAEVASTYCYGDTNFATSHGNEIWAGDAHHFSGGDINAGMAGYDSASDQQSATND